MKHVSEILREMKLLPEPEDLAQKPQPRPQECDLCHQTFTAAPHWFGSSWKFPNRCVPCGEHGLWAKFLRDRDFWQDIEGSPESPPVHIFRCGGCGQEERVKGKFEAGLWSYHFKCHRCGETGVNQYRLKTICELCRKPMFMDEDNPVKRCKPCLKKRKIEQKRFGDDGEQFRGVDDEY